MRPWIGTFVGLAGLSASLTVVYLGMRSVMEIGGACASGGPYEISTPCPDGVAGLMVAGIWGLFIFGGLFAWHVGKFGSSYVGLVGFAWCALFLSLGWNFLEFGLDPPDGDGGAAVGWLVCAVLFALMGGLPLLGLAKPSNVRKMLWPEEEEPAEQRRPTVREVVPVAGMTLRRSAEVTRATPATRGATALVAPSGDVATQLERLARLHHRGDLDDAEYDAAKRAVLGE